MPPLTRAHPRPLWPIQNRGAPGKLIFGFIVPRTSQMADLVNTCRTRVPHLPRLLPLPTLKSWVAVMILKSAPHPKIPKKLVVVVVVVVAVEAKGMQRGQGLIVQSPHDTCPPRPPSLALAHILGPAHLHRAGGQRQQRHLCALSVPHGLPAPKPERCHLHRANAVVCRF